MITYFVIGVVNLTIGLVAGYVLGFNWGHIRGDAEGYLDGAIEAYSHCDGNEPTKRMTVLMEELRKREAELSKRVVSKC